MFRTGVKRAQAIFARVEKDIRELDLAVQEIDQSVHKNTEKIRELEAKNHDLNTVRDKTRNMRRKLESLFV